MILLDLFSGIGGFAKGFEQAGHKIKKHYFSEVDKHAIANYKYNFKKAKYVGSVTDVRGSQSERPDIITFGSPCQDFSLAGKRSGMEGERSSLIREAIRIIGETKPSVFIWENVKGAFSSNDGADFWAIIQAFANIGGYRLEWQLLNTSWFLPQNRERIYLVGHLDGRSEPGVFPVSESNPRFIKGKSNSTVVRALTAGGHSGGHHSGMTLVKQLNDKKNFGESTKQQDRVYDPSGLMPCLTGGTKGNASSYLKIKVQSVATPNRKEKDQNGSRFKEGDSFTLCSQEPHGVMITSGVKMERTEKGKELRKDYENGKISHGYNEHRIIAPREDLKSNTIDTNQKSQMIFDKSQIRRLTEQECESLQGFPDDWTKYGNYDGEIKEISRTQRYKMCGNAVTTDVVQTIAERIKIKKL